MSKRRDLIGFKNKALKDPNVKTAYDELAPIYEVKRQLIHLRQKAGLSQQELAERLNTAKSNISRLESTNSKHAPRIDTITAYAKALGYKIELKFKRERQPAT